MYELSMLRTGSNPGLAYAMRGCPSTRWSSSEKTKSAACSRWSRRENRQRIGLEHIVCVDRDDPLAGRCVETGRHPSWMPRQVSPSSTRNAWTRRAGRDRAAPARPSLTGPFAEHDPFEALMSLREHASGRGQLERLDRRASVDAGHHENDTSRGRPAAGTVARHPIGFEHPVRPSTPRPGSPERPQRRLTRSSETGPAGVRSAMRRREIAAIGHQSRTCAVTKASCCHGGNMCCRGRRLVSQRGTACR